MPVTRSHKTSAPASSGGVRAEPSDRTSTSSTEATSATATATTSTTETSGTTDDTSTSAITVEESGHRTPARADQRDVKESTMTLVPRGSVRRRASVRSSETASRLKTLEAREELARIELERTRLELDRVQAEAALARARMERLELEEGVTSEDEEPEDRSVHVQEWVESTLQEGAKAAPSHVKPTAAKDTKKEEQQVPANTSSIQELADAIRAAIGASAAHSGATPPPRYLHELPYFDGNSGEWLAFKTIYDDTEAMFSPVQNMARLRAALRGTAREAVKSILFSNCPPSDVIDNLRRRFGRPDALALMEIDKLKNLPKCTDNPRDICMFASHVNNTVATMRGLNKPQYLESPEVIRIIIEKLTSGLRYRWFDFAADNNADDDYDLTLVAKYLNREAERCGKFGVAEVTDRGPRRQAPVRQVTHAAIEEKRDQKPARTVSQDSAGQCPQCKGDHRLYDCKEFKEASVQQRWEMTKTAGVCFRCLHSRHRKENCKRPPCKVCRRWHHHLLHSEGETRQQAKTEDAPVKEVANVRTPVNAVTTARAYLKIVPVELYGPKGSARVLALLDEGSTVTLLDAEVANEIGATGPKETLAIETVGGQKITKPDSMKLRLRIRGVHQNGKRTIKEVRTINEIHLAPQRIDRSRIEDCNHLAKMVDQLHYKEEPPRLLIGQDNWELIVSRAVRKGKPGQPVASLTNLGWVLHGSDSSAWKPVNFLTCAHVIEPDEELNKLIKDHFAIESLGIQPRRPSTDTEARALAILEERSRRLPEGRFETGLLWRNDNEEMPNNKKMAESRLKNLERKLDKDDEFKKEYERQIQNWLDNGYAEEAPDGSTSTKKWYLPHFAVTHPTKKKIRIVLDAAAKYQGKSLNDTLLPGPDLLQSLFGVLLRFRQGPVAVVADIKEMFLQIRIREEDRDSLRFLWRGERRTGEPKEYRMTSVIFGSASSPSTAIYIKNKNAAEHKDKYPEAARAVEKNHYMDDYLHSFVSEDLASRIAKEVKSLHNKAGFELRGWASNKEGALTGLADEATMSRTEVEIGKTEERTLGLLWATKEDTLSFNTHLRNTKEDVLLGNQVPTKRQVTSAVMSTFDPMGLASPVLIQGKKLLQDIWRSGVGWDEEVAPAEREAFGHYADSLRLLKEIRIPRCIAPKHTEGELHVFTDASETAYAAAIYWRTVDEEEKIHVTLVTGKARVSPMKIVSIPRLELQAAVLGSRLAHCVSTELDLKINGVSYWTDSSTVLSWIKSDPRTFKPFVAHRLAEIEDTTNPRDWRWVPSAQNPADDATRGIPEDFTSNHRWFVGPQFLHRPEAEWPAPRTFKRERTSEDKTETQSTAAVTKTSMKFTTPEPSRFSKWLVLLRTTARILQFIDLCRPKHSINAIKKAVRNDSPWRRNKKKIAKKATTDRAKRTERRFLPIDERHLEKAEKLLIGRSQEETFREDLVRLSRSKPLEKGSKLKRLDVVLEDGLLRLRGRIDAIKGLDKDYRRPLVLHGNHYITKLLIRYYHEMFNHGNHATVMNELRQRFWIIGVRSTVRAIVHQCQWCRVRRAAPQQVPTGDLPEERLRYGEAPFTCTGVDYFGPMVVTVGRRHEKRWGALFTCLTTRAVHLELASSLTADSMIMALRRMAARRGMPKVIFSDNGTNFVGANKELQEAINQLKEEGVVAETEKLGVRWKYIPPGAPNMGGAWERLVRSVKTALNVTLKERYPKEEVLHTLLLEAEHIINSRPLTDIDDSNEEEALTPNHFLIGRSCGAPRIGAFSDGDTIGRPTWKTAQRLADHFWSRWVKEYLPTLLPRKIDGGASTRDLRRGDVVLIVDSTLPRNTWPRGRVIQCHPGPDGRTRIVDVATTGGVLRRPNSKVVLLVPGVAEPGTGATHEGEDVGDTKT